MNIILILGGVIIGLLTVLLIRLSTLNKSYSLGLNTGVKKYDIQMFFKAIIWNIFWFGLLYFIIGPEKMWEFWYILLFMFILSLFQYIGKWDYAWVLYLGAFFFLIFYLIGNDIINFWKGDQNQVVRFEIFNKETGQIYKGWTPKELSINYEYDIQPEIGSSIQVEIVGKSFYFIDTLTGGDNWDTTFPRHPKDAKFFITAVKK